MARAEPLNFTSPASNDTSRFFPSDAGRIAQMVVVVVICVVGVSLNGLVVWVLGVRRAGRASRTSTRNVEETRSAGSFRVYVVNLALADLVLLLRTPLMLGYLANNCSWPFGKVFCHVVMFLRVLGLYAGAFLLCAVALERCLCLLRPIWAGLRRPRWAVPLACASLWLLAVVLASPYLKETQLISLGGRLQCLDSGSKVGPAFIAMETTAGFLLPLVIFLLCYTAVLVSARRAERGACTPVSSPGSPMAAPYTSRRMARLYRVLFLTMLLFLTCWVPYFTCRFLRALAGSREGWEALRYRAVGGTYVSLYLVYLKSALNPILYVFAARGLGKTVRKSLLSAIERVFNEETSESLRRKSLRRKDSQV